MLSPKVIRAQREQTARELRAELRARDRKRLEELREAIKAARAKRTEAMRRVRDICREGRIAARLRIAERRAELRAELRRLAEEERSNARAQCSATRDRTRERSSAKIEEARAALATERADQRLISGRGRKRPKLATARELERESDDEVRNNLPAELVPVFDRVKRGVKAGPRRSRTEAFLEWAAEHPSRVYEIQQAEHAAELARLERDEAKLRRSIASGDRYRWSSETMAAALEGPGF